MMQLHPLSQAAQQPFAAPAVLPACLNLKKGTLAAAIGFGLIGLVACQDDSGSPQAQPTMAQPDLATDTPHTPRPESTEQLLSTLTFPDSNNYPNNIQKQVQGSIAAPSSPRIYNLEAVIPPQCYTKHENKYNPCMTCHQSYDPLSRPNAMNDGDLQRAYAFSDIGKHNHWSNLFEDRRTRMAKISDQAVIDYIYTDNYSPLVERINTQTNWQDYVPNIANFQLGADAFDKTGFAKDDSGWVAFNYKPFPSTFWPTNGSTDDVIVRLPAAFRQSCDGQYSKDAYLANLSIMEMSIKDLTTISTLPIDETKACQDLNGDNQLTTVTQIKAQDHYVGGAKDRQTHKMLYPEGVEFIHSVRYVGIKKDGEIFNPPRFKELRYMKKSQFYSEADLRSRYGKEEQEKAGGALPSYTYRAEAGSSNNFGWVLQGYIEDKTGSLRQQTQEETAFCMGCHTTIGSTIDQTFAFGRKVTGAKGWGYINLKGMSDAPNVGMQQGEIFNYMSAVGGGDEFRQNVEMLNRWFNDQNQPIADKVKGKDVYTLITPSVERALDLNKAYMTIVADQDFIQGRDANITPATNVYQEVDEATAPVLPENKTRHYDIRLDW